MYNEFAKISLTVQAVSDSKVHGANIRPTLGRPAGPRWAPCGSSEPCYLGLISIQWGGFDTKYWDYFSLLNMVSQLKVKNSFYASASHPNPIFGGSNYIGVTVGTAALSADYNINHPQAVLNYFKRKNNYAFVYIIYIYISHTMSYWLRQKYYKA